MKDADASLCVLSVPEVVEEGRVVIPDRIEELFTSSTHILLNKMDLCASEDVSLAVDTLRERHPVWPVSLTSGEGLEMFLAEFGRLVNEK